MLNIYVYTYQTGFTSGSYNLNDVVDDLKEHLFNFDKVADSCKIVFVCHSMGGIVVRKFLVDNSFDLWNRKIEIGLFLLASPSIGSKYANWMKPIVEAMGQSQAVALQFGEDNLWLNDLDKNFIKLYQDGPLKIKGKELLEDKFIILKGLIHDQVVPPYAGAKYFSDSYKISGSDHFSIATPKDKDSKQHKALRVFLIDKIIVKEFNNEVVSLSDTEILSEEQLIIDIQSGDPLIALNAAQLLTSNKDILDRLVEIYPTTPVTISAIKVVIRSNPSESAKVLMEKIYDQELKIYDWGKATTYINYFDPVHSNFCEHLLWDIITKAYFRDPDTTLIAINALGRCGSGNNGSTLLLGAEIVHISYEGVYEEKYWSWILEALARLFVNNIDDTSGISMLYPVKQLLRGLKIVEEDQGDSIGYASGLIDILNDCSACNIDGLIHMLESDLPVAQNIAADVLGNLGVSRSVPFLILLAENSLDEYLVKRCSCALGNIATDSAVEWLRHQDQNSLTREGLILVLHLLQRDDVFRIGRMFLNSDEPRKFFVIRAFGLAKLNEGIPVIRKYLSSKDHDERATAVLALSRLDQLSEKDLKRYIQESSQTFDRLFSRLALILISPNEVSTNLSLIRKELVKHSYKYHKLFQQDILDILIDTNQPEAIKLAEAWKRFYCDL